MTWVKVDDHYPRHPKVMGLSDQAFRADVVAMCYCAEQGTDGLLTASYLKFVTEQDRAELIEAGRWDLNEDETVSVHDYLEYNPSQKEQKKRSQSARKAARTRWADVVQSDTDATRIDNALGAGVGAGVEVGLEVLKSKALDFADFWQAYPRKVGKIKAHQRWNDAIAAGVAPEDLISAALALAADPNRADRFTPHPATWINQGRWMDVAPEPRQTKRSAALQIADQLERQGL